MADRCFKVVRLGSLNTKIPNNGFVIKDSLWHVAPNIACNIWVIKSSITSQSFKAEDMIINLLLVNEYPQNIDESSIKGPTVFYVL